MSDDDVLEIGVLSSADERYLRAIGEDELRRYVAIGHALAAEPPADKLIKLAGEIEEFLKTGSKAFKVVPKA